MPYISNISQRSIKLPIHHPRQRRHHRIILALVLKQRSIRLRLLNIAIHIRNYEKQIDYLLRFLQQGHGISSIEETAPRHIKEFLLNMTKTGRTTNYVNDLLKAFKVFFRYAFEEGYTDQLLTQKIRNVKGEKTIIRTFTEQELKQMINFYQGHDYLTIRNKVIMLMLIDKGIRLSELTGLTEEQIKYYYIIIRGKGSKERVVPKSPQLSKLLIKFQTVRKSYFAYKLIPDVLFLSKNAKPLTNTMIDRIVKDAGRACGVSADVRISAHTFRHTSENR
ncbi:MAG: tyrosine-type recombinase/integrase [Clostridia bacterium]|nr:tyrosine-type recombinase/integrase [Clostridia bacterium]